MAFSGGVNWVAIQKALYDWVVSCTGLAAGQVVWGRQQAPRNTQPGIVMKLSFIQDDEMPWVDHEPNYITFDDITVSSVDDSTNVLTAASHGRLTGDGPVQLVGTDLPDGTEEEVNYWIIKVTDNTFKLASTYVDAMNGLAVDLADAGSGAITLVDTDTTQRTGEEVKFYQRALIKMVLTLECFTGVGVGLDMAEATLWRINAKRKLPTQIAILDNANIGVIQVDRVRTIEGSQDWVLFEPRALVDVMLHITSEDTEYGTTIERTEITNEDTGHVNEVEGTE